MGGSEKSPIVGIDLGTTYSAVCGFEAGAPRLFENPLGELLTPSAVAWDGRSRSMVVGRIARDILATQPSMAAAWFKRDIGTERTHRIAERTLTPIELSAYVLDSLRGDAERALGCPVNRCVVTVPAYFDEAQRLHTKLAAETAGLAVERVLNEPTAAAIAYGLQEGKDELRFAVVDLGGGTFDVCIMELFEGALQVSSVAGVSRLGGEDFTAALARLAARRAGRDLDDMDTDARAVLIKRAEMLKRQLSRWDEAEIVVPAVGKRSESAVVIRASEAEAGWRDLLDRLIAPCREALRAADVTAEDLDDVVLVGGASRMPCVRRVVGEVFAREPRSDQDPDLLVARGAGVQAGLCARDAAVADLVVTDVAAHSLGVATSRPVGQTMVPGYFSPVIHRNTVIPVSRSDLFYTASDWQTTILLEVFEGESRRCADNTAVGTLRIDGLPRAPAGDQPVMVTFTYDVNGILGVTARVQSTGETFSAIFQRRAVPLEGDELERAAERIRALRSPPALRPRYRDLIGRAELLFQETQGQQRETLDLALTGFEAALAEGDPATIDRAFELLVGICAAIDQGERW